MPKYRLDVAYDGTDFHGYARQPDLRTVQGELERALAHHTGPIESAVAGRTDKGVHATGQVLSFAHPIEIDTARVLRSLNTQLGDEIAVIDLRRVADDFHARFSATARAYRYEILNRETHDPLLARISWHVRQKLDVDAMNEASVLVVGEHDFASFCRKEDDVTLMRDVLWAGWRTEGDVLEFSIAANAFCHQMVRSLVGVLVDVGRMRVTPADVKTILAARDRSRTSGPAPPHGLTLVGVGYPDEPLEAPDWITSTP